MLYIGLDLGTGSMKGLLVDGKGKILREARAAYSVSYPAPGFCEQAPEDWRTAALAILQELASGYEGEIGGLSVGGQMHGLVLLDENGEVLRPAILWNDGRTGRETEWLNQQIGEAYLMQACGNIAFAGFTAPKLLWVKENEPEIYARIHKILLPKDYLVYCLTGVYATDYSDASGTLWLDVEHKCWSKELCRICGVEPAWLPQLYESYEIVGEIRTVPGLNGVKVTAGAGDNAAAAVGTGAVHEGDCNISLGTSGTVFLSDQSFLKETPSSLHHFAHANGKWHRMGVVLSAASANAWWLETILQTGDYAGAVSGMADKRGVGRVFFLPYLTGERCPHNDVNARGAFLGLSADTTREEMSLAVLEGVAFALRDGLDASNTRLTAATLCGGGSKSKLWRQILADVLGCEIRLPAVEEGPAYGAAMLAMVADGIYPDVMAAADAIVRVNEIVQPDKKAAQRYEKKYQIYRKYYDALKTLSQQASEL